MEPNPTESCKLVKDFGPSIGEKARLSGGQGGGYQRREGRNGIPGRGNSICKDPEKWKDLQCRCGGLRDVRCWLRQVGLGEELQLWPMTLGVMVGLKQRKVRIRCVL